MRVIVSGGRDFTWSPFIHEALDTIHKETPITELTQGGARGVDTIARDWAMNKKIPTKTYLAKWRQHGKAAGPKRNKQMLDGENPDTVIVFPGGRGTAHMRQIALEKGIPVVNISPRTNITRTVQPEAKYPG